MSIGHNSCFVQKHFSIFVLFLIHEHLLILSVVGILNLLKQLNWSFAISLAFLQTTLNTLSFKKKCKLLMISRQNGIGFSIFISVILRISEIKLYKVLNAVLTTWLSGTKSCYYDDLMLMCETIQFRLKLLQVVLCGMWHLQRLQS